jgi:hypothetical protein
MSQDAAKVFAFYLMKKFNVFSINDTGALVLPERVKTLILEQKERELEATQPSHHSP